MTLLVRVHGEPSALVPVLRETVRHLDPALPLSHVRSQREWLDESAAQPRLTTRLAAAFALTALLLAAVGVYGVVAYSVGQRTQEIGLRVALGARPGQVSRMVLRSGLTTTGIGITLGLAGAFAADHVVQNLLFEVPARDPTTFAAAAAALVIVALAACYVPAVRAARVDPTLALRCE